MPTRTQALPLVLSCALYGGAGRLAAEEPAGQALPAANAPAVGLPAEAVMPLVATDGEAPTAGRRRLLPHCLARLHARCCWSDHNQPGCGSFHSELTFIFGRCRKFFGEPCLSKPPTAPGGPPQQPCCRGW